MIIVCMFPRSFPQLSTSTRRIHPTQPSHVTIDVDDRYLTYGPHPWRSHWSPPPTSYPSLPFLCMHGWMDGWMDAGRSGRCPWSGNGGIRETVTASYAQPAQRATRPRTVRALCHYGQQVRQREERQEKCGEGPGERLGAPRAAPGPTPGPAPGGE